MRVYEIAKQLGVSSKEVLLLLEQKGMSVKSHMAQLDSDTLKVIQNFYAENLTNGNEQEVDKKKVTSFLEKQEEPVQIPSTSLISKQKKDNNEENKVYSRVQDLSLAKNPEAKLLHKSTDMSVGAVRKEVLKSPKLFPEKSEHGSQSDVIHTQEKRSIIGVEDKKEPVGIIAQDMTVEQFAELSRIPAPTVIVSLLKWGIVAAKNRIINKATVEKLCQSLNIPLMVLEKNASLKKESTSIKIVAGKKLEESHLKERLPVVVVIGHVDHGKTTLLDFIRKTKIAAKEKGGITQHLGAYEAKTASGNIVFIDTPGHEAFSKIRQRGVRIADIAILVVAADDGVKPQTIEAIKIAQEMHTPIVVALNKIDKVPESQIDVIKQQLMQYGVVSEEYGGESIVVPISAKTGKNIDLLLEMVNLQAQMMELRADFDTVANGYVLESKIEKGRGPVATVILQNGVLHKGDYFSCGNTIGHVNTMMDYLGKMKESVYPSIPVQISGFDKLPSAGDYLVSFSKSEYLQRKNEISKQIFLSNTRSTSHNVDALRIILKADNDSSREALVDSITKQFKNQGQDISIISSGIGNINESDVELAYNTGAEIFGLHVRADAKTSALAVQKYISMYTFDIIYRLFDAISAKLEAKKEIVVQKVKVGEAVVIKVFDIKKVGEVAGCRVNSGKIVKGGIIIVYRGKEKIGETKVASLQKEKESVSEVRAGFECGIVSKEKNFSWQLEDRLECFVEE